MSTTYQTDLHYARLRAQRALLDAGQVPNKPIRKEKERLYKQINRRVQR